MKKYSVAIIGGGFSGLCLGVMLKKMSDRLLILEANKRIGKKILATGNGQGNLTNISMGSQYYHGDVELVESALKRYGNHSMLDFFNDLGLLTAEREGRIYPASFTAGAILDVLRFSLYDANVQIEVESEVVSVEKKDCFIIKCRNGITYLADKVVLAFGGKSGSGFMTDGKSFSLALSLGHTVTDLWPSLVQLKCEREKIRGLKGIKTDARVSLYNDKELVCTKDGDLLFTDYGISGNSAFSVSSYIKGCKNAWISIEFMPGFSKKELANKLCDKLSKKITVERLLISVLPTRLSQVIMKYVNVNADDIANELTVNKIVEAIKDFKLKIEGTAGFDNSQVTAGGISTREIDGATLQSKLVKGLYIIGEALNVDGDCGGYNLQWAYTSAAIVAEAINEKG